MIKDTYEEIRKKYRHLPPFDEIDHEFEISTLESDKFLLRGIRKKMSECLEEVSGYLGNVVHPGSENPAAMYEWRFFDNKEKKSVLQLFKRVQFYLRTFDEAGLMQDDENNARVISEVLKGWKEIKKECIPIIKKAKEGWIRETDEKEDLGYLG